MPGISILTNFDVNYAGPIDSRLVATSSTARYSLSPLYEGLKVYQTDDKKTYVWNGTTWSAEGSGIYGGSGSLIGDTVVSLGSVGSFPTNKSLELTFGTNNGNTKSRIINQFYRHTASIGNLEYAGLEFRQQLAYIDNTGTQKLSSYIGFNSLSQNNYIGEITLNTGDPGSILEAMRVTKYGRIGIGTNDPKESLQIGSWPSQPSTLHNSFNGQSLPITFHKGGNAVIGYNWYYNGGDFYFDLTKGSSRISQSDGEVTFSHRQANSPAGDFVQSLHLSKNGKLGVGTGFDNNNLPVYLLDVNGGLRANNAKINSTLTASNIYATSNYFLPNTNYIITSAAQKPFLVKNNSTNNELFYISDIGSTFYTGLGVFNGNVNVDQSVTIQNGSLLVNNNGSITNYEDPVYLTPSGGVVYYCTNGADYGSNTIGLQNFTYSFNFTRVGTLIKLDYYIKRTIGAFNLSGTQKFYGIGVKFSTSGVTSKFKSNSISFGAGFGGHDNLGQKVPVISSVSGFSGGGADISLGANDFNLKIALFVPMANGTMNANQGGDFIGQTGLTFRGSVIYSSTLNSQPTFADKNKLIDIQSFN